MLQKIRISLAFICFALISLLFLDFTGSLHAWFGWLAKIQLLPAILALNIGVVITLIILTIIFGRVYCSVICPLGIFQDVAAWINGRRKKKKYRFSYSPPFKWLRYGVLWLFVIALIAGIGPAFALLDPYGSYGRIAQNLFAPLWTWTNNLVAYIAERNDSYTFYETDVWLKSLPTFIIAAITFIVLIVLAWRNGRTYCNTICPVGTALGFLSKYSLFRITIDPKNCNKCSLCARGCKASCINYKEHEVDNSRCVSCMNCLGKCKHGAISYKLNYVKSNTKPQIEKNKDSREISIENSRRGFFSLVSFLATTSLLKAQEKGDGGLAVIADKKMPNRSTPIVPAGSFSLGNMTQHCTACQLCVSVCPNQVLRPSSNLATLMQPEMSYERGYCRPECTKCSQVCPTGAINKITSADKSSVQIGHAVFIRQNCTVLADDVKCGNCARHCPSGAIIMVASNPQISDSPKVPVVNIERCIGCGACESLCPARPFSAIYVEGHERHRVI